MHTAVGLQSRRSPAVVRALDLIASGALGPVLTATVYSSTAGFGRVVAEADLPLELPETGMNLPTIQTAHTLDLAVALAGSLTGVAAMGTVQYPELTVGDPLRPRTRTFPTTSWCTVASPAVVPWRSRSSVDALPTTRRSAWTWSVGTGSSRCAAAHRGASRQAC